MERTQHAALSAQGICAACDGDRIRVQLDDRIDAGSILVERDDAPEVVTRQLFRGQAAGRHLGLQLGNSGFAVPKAVAFLRVVSGWCGAHRPWQHQQQPRSRPPCRSMTIHVDSPCNARCFFAAGGERAVRPSGAASFDATRVEFVASMRQDAPGNPGT